MIWLKALKEFISEAHKLGWDSATILHQIDLFAKGCRDGNLSDLCIILIDGTSSEMPELPIRPVQKEFVQ